MSSLRCKPVRRRERARAVTVVFGSLDVGSAVGLIVCGPLIAAAGWPAVFYLFAILGLVWCLAWPLLKPESHDPTIVIPEQPAHGVKSTGEVLVLLTHVQVAGTKLS